MGKKKSEHQQTINTRGSLVRCAKAVACAKAMESSA
jgi:hypothetical protein